MLTPWRARRGRARRSPGRCRSVRRAGCGTGPVTCPSPRSPAGCVTCWPARRCRCRRRYRGQRPVCALAVHPGGAPRLAARAEAEICQQEVLRRGRPALPWHPEPAGRPGLGQHHRRRVPGGNHGLPGPPVPAPDGPGPADHGTARRRPGPARARARFPSCRPPSCSGAARGVRRGGPSSQAPPTPPNCAGGAAAGRADDRDHPGATSPRAAAHGAWGARSRKSAPFK